MTSTAEKSVHWSKALVGSGNSFKCVVPSQFTEELADSYKFLVILRQKLKLSLLGVVSPWLLEKSKYSQPCLIRTLWGIVKMFELRKVRITEFRII